MKAKPVSNYILTLLACLAFASSAQAQTLFSNGIVAQPVPTNFLLNMAAPNSTIYDDFILDTNAVITGFRFSGFEDPGAFPSPNPYQSTTYSIIEGSNPQTGTVIANDVAVATRTPNGIANIPNYSHWVGYDYAVTGLNLPVAVGKRYWLGLSQSAPPGASTAFAIAPSTGSPLAGGLWQNFFGTFFSYPAEETFSIDGTPTATVKYSCQGFEAPMGVGPVKVNKKRALPLKVELFDTATGEEVTSANISAPPIISVIFNPGTGGTAVDVTGEVLAVGLGTEGNNFVFTSEGKWQYNLKTTNFTAPGTYTIAIIPGNEYVIIPTCATTLQIQ